jgi:hypothetical protein
MVATFARLLLSYTPFLPTNLSTSYRTFIGMR